MGDKGSIPLRTKVPIAQWLERRSYTADVGGSSPSRNTQAGWRSGSVLGSYPKGRWFDSTPCYQEHIAQW